MISMVCSGSPYEIGRQHGRKARPQIHSCIKFYTSFFLEAAQLAWPAVCAAAEKRLPYLEHDRSCFVNEMQGGVADGAEVPFISILALNTRTEIAYGLAASTIISDGCTAVSYHSPAPFKSSLLAQNWDWRPVQAPNLLVLQIHQEAPKAAISMVTEAGIIGKIGLNGNGVGVCLNAIAAKGVNEKKLSVHLALRAILDGVVEQSSGSGGKQESKMGTTHELAEMLCEVGVASAVHILLADPGGAIGLETSCHGTVQVQQQKVGNAQVVVHTNHYLAEHRDVNDREGMLADSMPRLERITQLVKEQGNAVGVEEVANWLKDEAGFPVGICRSNEGIDSDGLETLFNIVMNLNEKWATVTFGKPGGAGERITLC